VARMRQRDQMRRISGLRGGDEAGLLGGLMSDALALETDGAKGTTSKTDKVSNCVAESMRTAADACWTATPEFVQQSWCAADSFSTDGLGDAFVE
jgi:hypothetical protein